MTKDLIVAQAEQDQQWMELDDWYKRNQHTEDLVDIVELLSLPPTKPNLKQLKSELNLRGMEVVRLLALHTLRELVLRQKATKERAEDDTQTP